MVSPGLGPDCIAGIELYVAIASCKGLRPDGPRKLDEGILTSGTIDAVEADGMEGMGGERRGERKWRAASNRLSRSAQTG